MSELAVVHLARKANGVDPLERFLRSYARHPAGAEHELVVLLKGFDGAADAAAHLRLLEPFEHRALLVADRGFDIGSYLEAARRLEHGRLCLLNSYSTILAGGWLRALERPLGGDVGAVGATGSWASSSSLWYSSLRLPTPYGKLLAAGPRPERRLFRRLRNVVPALPMVWRALAFAPFPNFHLRTNAFAIGRELLIECAGGRIRTKHDAYKFESGRGSLTSRLLGMGLRALVVGRDGEAYEKEDWWRSETLWQGDQQNLLVADNQTEDYSRGDPARRWLLSTMAWGDRALPA